jgi:transposase
MGCTLPRCDDGRTQGKSTLFELLGIQDCSKLQQKHLKTFLQNRESHIFEYLLQNRKMILNDKDLLWLHDSQSMRSFQTSVPESTGQEKAFYPFWTEHSKAISKKLWLPQETDYAVSHLSSSTGCFKDQGLDCWSSNHKINPLNKSSQMTSCPLSRCFAAAEMEKEDTDVIKMRKVKLKPTTAQKHLLSKFADGARFTYNAAVEKINSGTKVNKMSIRNDLVTEKDNDYFADKQWLLETPKAIRQQAVFEACKSFKTCFTNLKNKNIKHFKVNFKSKRNKTWTIGIERAVKCTGSKSLEIFPTYLKGSFGFFGKLPFDSNPSADCSIHKDKCGRFFLQVPIKCKVVSANLLDKRPVVALDPGVRKFLTGSSSDGSAFTIGDGLGRRLVTLLKTIDCIDTMIQSAVPKERKYLRKKKLRLFQNYKNIRDEFHWKTINFLTKEYSCILIPALQTQPLSQKLRTKTNREMMALSHYTFLQRLKQKCKERNVGLMVVQEDFTTKTCGCCGQLVDIRDSEVFSCPNCLFVTDRDVNAARNILLKHLRVTSIDRMIDAYLIQMRAENPS